MAFKTYDSIVNSHVRTTVGNCLIYMPPNTMYPGRFFNLNRFLFLALFVLTTSQKHILQKKIELCCFVNTGSKRGSIFQVISSEVNTTMDLCSLKRNYRG